MVGRVVVMGKTWGLSSSPHDWYFPMANFGLTTMEINLSTCPFGAHSYAGDKDTSDEPDKLARSKGCKVSI